MKPLKADDYTINERVYNYRQNFNALDYEDLKSILDTCERLRLKNRTLNHRIQALKSNKSRTIKLLKDMTFYHCPKCSTTVYIRDNYCSKCGTKIKWI